MRLLCCIPFLACMRKVCSACARAHHLKQAMVIESGIVSEKGQAGYFAGIVESMFGMFSSWGRCALLINAIAALTQFVCTNNHTGLIRSDGSASAPSSTLAVLLIEVRVDLLRDKLVLTNHPVGRKPVLAIGLLG